MFLVIFNSVQKIGNNENIWIEAEDAVKIEKGIEIFEDDDASLSKAIDSKLQSHLIGSFASYEFDVMNNGGFYLWARNFWPEACSNSFKISHDQENTYILGNDYLENQFIIWPISYRLHP